MGFRGRITDFGGFLQPDFTQGGSEEPSLSGSAWTPFNIEKHLFFSPSKLNEAGPYSFQAVSCIELPGKKSCVCLSEYPYRVPS